MDDTLSKNYDRVGGGEVACKLRLYENTTNAVRRELCPVDATY